MTQSRKTSVLCAAAAGVLLTASWARAQEIELLKDINETHGSSSLIRDAVEMDGYVLFTALDETAGRELWRTDGTTAGTYRVADLREGDASSSPVALTRIGDLCVFWADDGTGSGAEPWRTDGTEAGTFQLADTVPGSGSGVPENPYGPPPAFETFGDHAVLGLVGSPPALWVTDGTIDGTRALTLPDGTFRSLGSSGATFWFAVDQFDAESITYTMSLFRIDGDTSAPIHVRDFQATHWSLGDAEYWHRWDLRRVGALPASRALVLCAPSHPWDRPGATWIADTNGARKISNAYSVLSWERTEGRNLGDLLIFAGTDDRGRSGVLRTDGTTVSLVAATSPFEFDFVNWPTLTQPARLTFSARRSGQDPVYGVYVTDGFSLMEVSSGAPWERPAAIGVAGSTLLFAQVDEHGRELWRSEGTPWTTTLLRDFSTNEYSRDGLMLYSGTPSDGGSAEMGGRVHFVAFDGRQFALWSSDGTDAGTLRAEPERDASSMPILGRAGGRVLYVSADGPDNDRELWASDGTTAALVRDINRTAGTDTITGGSVVGSEFWFAAEAPGGATNLGAWRSDGTAQGTRPLPFPSRSWAFTPVGDRVFLNGIEASGSTSGVYVFDGTACSSVPDPDGATDGTALLFAVDGMLWAATSPAVGARFWTTDGTQDGTRWVALAPDVAAEWEDLYAGGLGVIGTTGYIAGYAYDSFHPATLWRTDPVEGLVRLSGELTAYGGTLTQYAGKTWFVGTPDWGRTLGLYATDGSRDSAELVVPGSWTYTRPVVFSGWMWFLGWDDEHGAELWRTDGETAALFADLAPGTDSSAPCELTVVGDRLYFSTRANTGDAAYLWRLDRGGDTPVLVKEFHESYAAPRGLTAFADELYFVAGDDDIVSALWRSDGTETGTVLVKEFTRGHDWTSDGYAREDTWIVGATADTLFVAADDFVHGQELWVYRTQRDSDGDGLWDSWERPGTYLGGLGASPDRKDVFVQVDWMGPGGGCPGHRPTEAEKQKVVDAFAAQDIALHIEMGREVEHADEIGMLWNGIYNWSRFDEIKAAVLASERALSFHCCLFAHRLGGSNRTGVSRGIPDADFIVALGSLPDQTGTPIQQWGTFMHELGHNLGLRHGGTDPDQWKPNYLSVMNYLFQTTGLIQGGVPGTLDYSRVALLDLDENRLDETLGLGPDAAGYGTRWWLDPAPYVEGQGKNAKWVDPPPELRETLSASGPIDWDRSGDLGVDVKADVNVGPNPAPAVFTVLRGCEDWVNLVFTGGNIGREGAPVDPPAESPVIEEIDTETVVLLGPAPPPVDLRAQVAGAQVVLTWRPVGPRPEQQYRVYRSAAGGDPAVVVETANVQFLDATVEPGTAYAYKVAVLGANGAEGSASVPVTVTTR